MAEFVVVSEVTISMHTRVEAKTAKEAVRVAEGRGMVGLCHQCSGGDPREEWVTSGELDGEPQKIRVEE